MIPWEFYVYKNALGNLMANTEPKSFYYRQAKKELNFLEWMLKKLWKKSLKIWELQEVETVLRV